MPPFQSLPPQQYDTSISPRNSASPLITADQRKESQQAAAEGISPTGTATDVDPKPGKRGLFGLGKKKDDKAMETTSAPGMMPHTQAAVSAMQPASSSTKRLPAELKPQQPALSSPRHPYPSAMASPSRLRSSSPRLHSPASSEIFERNVQEPVAISTLQGEIDPAHIATHVITEDHIPPALEASAQAITSGDLNADEVEIVMSASHQPAAASVIESSASHADLTQLHKPSLPHYESGGSEPSSVHQSGILPAATEDEGASNYGELDPNDYRRLSFISFADVVQSEHQQQAGSALADAGSRDSLHIANFQPSIASVAQQHDRAASPLRTPRSPGSTHNNSMSGGVTTPPLGPPATAHGELHIETMRQAVRKTASGDLSGVRSSLTSPVSDEQSMRETRSRTNT